MHRGRAAVVSTHSRGSVLDGLTDPTAVPNLLLRDSTPRRRRQSSMMRRRSFLMLAFALASARARGEAAASFQLFLDAVWRDAAARGIKRETFDAALAGVTPDPAVLAAKRQQPEYGKPFGAYLASLASPARLQAGLRKSAQWDGTLRAVEKKFGVDRSILVSIWGIESSFDEGDDRWDIFRSLATLAHAGFQHPLFRDELLSALKMLSGGPRAAPAVRRLMGRRHGTGAIPAVELSHLRGGLRR